MRPLIVLAGLLGAAPAAGDEAGRILADPRFEFCHAEAYPLTPAEARWCPLVGEDNPRCPRFAAACEAPRAEAVSKPGRFAIRRAGSGPGDGKGSGGEPAADPERGPARSSGAAPRSPSDGSFDLPDLGGLGAVLFWVVVGALVAAVLVLVLRHTLGSGRDADEGAPGDDVPPPDDAPPELAAVPVREARRLLALARQAAAAGDHDRSLALAQAALLYGLRDAGLVELRRSRTHGDYLRALHEHPAQYDAAALVFREVARVRYGRRPATREAIDRVLGRLEPLLGALALCLVPWLAGCGGETYPWGPSPSGNDAIIELGAGRGIDVGWRRHPVTPHPSYPSEGGIAACTVVLRGAHPTPEEWTALLKETRWPTDLIIANGGPLPDALDCEIEDGARASGPLRVPGEPDLELRVPDPGRVDCARDARPTIVRPDGEPYAVAVAYRGREIEVLADDALFTNVSLAVADNAVYTAALLERCGPRLELIDAWSLARDAGPMQAAFDGPHALVVLQLLLGFAVFLLARGVRLGEPRDEIAGARRSFGEHVRALGALYASAGDPRFALRTYAGWALDRLRARLRVHTGGVAALAAAAARRTGDDPERVRATLERATRALDGAGEPGPGDLETLRALARILRETGGDR